MGTVSLNGKVLEHSFTAPTILELVSAIEEQFVESGTIIIDVSVNGVSLSEFAYEDGSLMPFDASMTIEVTARDLHEIMITSIDEFEKYFDRLIPSLPDVASLFREGDEIQRKLTELESGAGEIDTSSLRVQSQKLLNEANQYYIDVVDGVRVMIELIQGLSGSKNIDFAARNYSGRTLIELTGDLKETIQSLVEAQTDAENTRIADLLEKNLVRDLTMWRDAFTQVGTQLKAQQKS